VKGISNIYLKNGLIVLAYILGLLLIMYRFLGDRFFDFGTTLMDRSGDGFKNYFAFAWQYKQEGGYWFDGMQYPYGDLLSFADGQPAVTMVLVGLKKIGIDFSGNELLLVQGLPLLAVFVAAFFLHKIMRAYEMPLWWTMITVFACIALSPQVYRFNAHYTLAYMFCFPSIWYVLIRSNRADKSKLTHAILIAVLLLIYGFIHPYHLLIGSVFLLAYFLVKAVQKDFDWYALLSGLAPVIIYMLINAVIDPADDRIKNPWGAWHYKAEISDLFPFYGWYVEWFGDIVKPRSKRWEGYAYLGVLFFAFPYFILRSKEILRVGIESRHKLKNYIWGAILSLLFAMGLHIILTDHKILQWISSLQQFRALGRFSWPFYYIGFISLAIMFYRATIGLQRKWLVYALFGFTVIMWMVDANAFMSGFRYKVQEYVSSDSMYTSTQIKDVLDKHNLSAEDFQAILPLPVSMEGAEKIRPYRSYFPRMRGLPYAFQSGLPFIGAHMSRNSLSRILKQYQLCSSSYVDKVVIQDFRNRKDVLMLLSRDDSLDFADLALKAEEIEWTKHMGIFRMSLDSLEKMRYISKDDLQASSTALFYSDFGSDNGPGLFSDGYRIQEGQSDLAKISVDGMAGDTLRFSFWLRVDADKSTSPAANIHIRNKEGKQIKHTHYSDMDMKRCEVIGNWIQIKRDLVLPEGSFELTWKLSSEYLIVDHALITKVGGEQYWKPMKGDYLQYGHYIAQAK